VKEIIQMMIQNDLDSEKMVEMEEEDLGIISNDIL
jgi:hypothetical protein